MMKKRILFGLIPLLLCAVWAQKPIASAKTVVASADNILRLHVIAASDSEKDQRDKLAVRDAILPLFSAAESYEDARTFLLNHGREIQSAAEATLKARGSDNGVQLSLGTETFPDRIRRHGVSRGRVRRAVRENRSRRRAQLVVRAVPAAVHHRRAGRDGRS